MSLKIAAVPDQVRDDGGRPCTGGARRYLRGMAAELSLIVNGEPRRAAPGWSIADLVSSLGLDPKKVAVERNGEIAPRSTLADVMLGEGDVLEIVHFVGGG